jgi:hypothetical protein
VEQVEPLHRLLVVLERRSTPVLWNEIVHLHLEGLLYGSSCASSGD